MEATGYHGAVEILDRTRLVVDEVEVRLWKQGSERAGVWTWGGFFGPVAEEVEWPTKAILLFPDGTERQVVLTTRVATEAETVKQWGVVTGTGDPPF